jgi:pyocin large subunit-like protein
VGSVNTVLRVPSSEKWYEFKPTRNIMDAPKTKVPAKKELPNRLWHNDRRMISGGEGKKFRRT